MSEIKKRSKGGKSKKDENAKLVSSEDVTSGTSKSVDSPKDDNDAPPPKFGPMPKVSPHRLWSRFALIMGLMTVVWYNSRNGKETPIASYAEDIRFKSIKITCSSKYEEEMKKFPECTPNQCGRIVTDEMLSGEEIYALSDLVQRGFRAGKQNHAVSVLDFSSGVLRTGSKSLDLYKLNKTQSIFQHGDLLIFQAVKTKMMRMISSYFGVNYWSMGLTAPAHAVKISDLSVKLESDMYWNPTVHKELFPSYQYSVILFLSDFQRDHQGGRLVFLDNDLTNRTVDGRKGRVVAFTSGYENKHTTERVLSGNRITLTLGFTCNTKHVKKDPPL